jgi:hypothetical protein
MQSRTIAGIAIPDSALAREATTIARASLPREIYNHCMRTFLFAELLGRSMDVDHDSELLYVGAILHDAGLSPLHMSEKEHFQVDGANLSRDVLKRYGVIGSKADVVWDSIALHDQSAIAEWKAKEVMLVSLGVGADFGGRIDRLARGDVQAVLEAAPRDNFVPAFLAAATAVVAKKPATAAPSWLTDVAVRTVPGFHYENFVDILRAGDPFAAFA